MNAPLKPLPGRKMEVKALLNNSFKRSIEEENFEVQYKFRMQSIATIF